MTCKARLEEAGVGWVVLLWHDLADVLDRDAAGDVKADLVGGGLVAPDGSLTARGEKARRAALRMLAERQVSPARIEALADTTDDVQAGSLGMTLAEAWERYAATPEQRETLAYKGALLFLSGFSCITGRVDDTARAFAGLLGAAGESEDGRRGAARALRDVALALEGHEQPAVSAEQEIDALRKEARGAADVAAEKVPHQGYLASWWDGRARGMQRVLDCLAPYLPPRGTR